MKLNSNILNDEKYAPSKKELIVLANILLIIAFYMYCQELELTYFGMDMCFFAECYM